MATWRRISWPLGMYDYNVGSQWDVWHGVCDTGGRMKVHSVRTGLLWIAGAVSLLAFTPAVSGQDKGKEEAKYRFRKGEVLKYEVKSDLDISMKGSDPDFLPGGVEAPLDWKVNGLFQNTVTEVGETDGVATLERKVLQVTSSGQFQGGKFKCEWDSAKDKEKLPADTGLMDSFVISMIQNPVTYQVDPEGKTILQFAEMNRLVMRRGMMSWLIKENTMEWVTTEQIAVPVLHDKITLEFKNKVSKDETRTGRRVRVIQATIALKEGKKEEGQRPPEVQGDVDFTASGTAKAEFDLTNGKLYSLAIDLKINLSGKAPKAGGGTGDIKGKVTYTESQVLKD